MTAVSTYREEATALKELGNPKGAMFLRQAADEIEKLRAALNRVAEPKAFFVATSRIDPEAYARMIYAQYVLDDRSLEWADKKTEEKTRARYIKEPKA